MRRRFQGIKHTDCTCRTKFGRRNRYAASVIGGGSFRFSSSDTSKARIRQLELQSTKEEHVRTACPSRRLERRGMPFFFDRSSDAGAIAALPRAQIRSIFPSRTYLSKQCSVCIRPRDAAASAAQSGAAEFRGVRSRATTLHLPVKNILIKAVLCLHSVSYTHLTLPTNSA